MRARTVTVSRDGADTWDVAPGVDATGWLARGVERGRAATRIAVGSIERIVPRSADRIAECGRARRRAIGWRRRGAPCGAGSSARGPGTATVGVSPGVPPALACEPADDPVGYRLGRWARLALTLTVLATVVVVAVALWPAAGAQRMVDVTVGPGTRSGASRATSRPTVTRGR